MFRLALGFLLACLLAPPLGAQEIPRDEEGFARFVAERLARELPEFNLQTAGRLVLEGKRADGVSSGQIGLLRIHEFCSRNTEACGPAIEQFARGIAQITRDQTRPIDEIMVRLAVRNRAYIEQFARQAGGDGRKGVFTRPLSRDLVIVPVLDFARAVRYVNEADLKTLGLDEAQLFVLGEENLRTATKPLEEVARVPPEEALGTIADEDYAPSRLIRHADWKFMADKLNGKLAVMVPTANLVVYGDASSDMAIEALFTLGVNAARRSTNPLSPAVLLWKETGWEQIRP